MLVRFSNRIQVFKTEWLNDSGLYMLKYATVVSIFFCFQQSMAQNLVPNPGFETFTMCPPANGATPPGPMLCPPWVANCIKKAVKTIVLTAFFLI